MSKAWTYRYRAKPSSFRDGDSLVALIDVGLRATMTLPLRLKGCNADKEGTPSGDAAAAFVEAWVREHVDPDGWLAVLTHKNPNDPHDRWQAEVQSIDGKHDLTDDLIAAGLAAEWDGRGEAPVPPWPPAPVEPVG